MRLVRCFALSSFIYFCCVSYKLSHFRLDKFAQVHGAGMCCLHSFLSLDSSMCLMLIFPCLVIPLISEYNLKQFHAFGWCTVCLLFHCAIPGAHHLMAGVAVPFHHLLHCPFLCSSRRTCPAPPASVEPEQTCVAFLNHLGILPASPQQTHLAAAVLCDGSQLQRHPLRRHSFNLTN